VVADAFLKDEQHRKLGSSSCGRSRVRRAARESAKLGHISIELLPSRRQLTPATARKGSALMLINVEERDVRTAVAGVINAGVVVS
jgi:hypothetical protein